MNTVNMKQSNYYNSSYTGKQNQFVNNINNKNNNSDLNNHIKSLYGNNEAAQSPNRIKNNSSSVLVSTYTDKDGRVHTTYTGKGTDVIESMRSAKTDINKDKEKIKKRLDYSYQKVSNQVVMAKNSLSASRAVLSARRILQELKNKLKTAECSDDEKQAALAHATSMLRIALKKKKHLELEEMVKATMQMDERMKKASSPSESISLKDIIDSSEEDNTRDGSFSIEDLDNEELDNEFDSEESLDDFSYIDINNIINIESDISEFGLSDNVNDDISSEDLIESIFDMNEELSDEMNELMDMMDMMEETINPHMDKEQFEKFKTKNRLEEQKEQVKADMEYLKVIISIPIDASISGSSLGFVTSV